MPNICFYISVIDFLKIIIKYSIFAECIKIALLKKLITDFDFRTRRRRRRG
jgi:hypothetical protein